MRFRMNNIAIAVFILLNTLSCGSKSVSHNLSLSETDRYYSTISEKKGRNAAFMAMFDSSAVMLIDNQMPIQGIKSISNHLKELNDHSFVLSWSPMHEYQSASADLGYTYGIYLAKDKCKGDTLEQGTYVTIWKKDNNGNWKAVLDTGNEGIKTNINQKHTKE